MNRRKSNKSLIMYTWERPGKLSTSPKWLKPSLKYHLQLKTKEDVGSSGLGLQGGGRKWSVHACVPSSFRCVRFFVILWTVARQVPLSMGLSRQECWSGLPCPPPGNLPDPGIKPMSSVAPALQVDSLPADPSGLPKGSLHLMKELEILSVERV